MGDKQGSPGISEGVFGGVLASAVWTEEIPFSHTFLLGDLFV